MRIGLRYDHQKQIPDDYGSDLELRRYFHPSTAVTTNYWFRFQAMD
jgi:hypothetical protein